jgi:hypothetical protein
VTDANISAIRAKLRFDHIDEFIQGYSQYISTAGLFIPMAAEKFKPLGSTVRFQFLLSDGNTTALLGEGIVVHHQPADPALPDTPPGVLVKFTKLSPSSKQTVERVVRMQAARETAQFIALSEPPHAPAHAPARRTNPTPAEPLAAIPRHEPVVPAAPRHDEPHFYATDPPARPAAFAPPAERSLSLGQAQAVPHKEEDPLAGLFDEPAADPRRASRPGDSHPGNLSQPGPSYPGLGAAPSQPGLDAVSEGSRQPKTLAQTERGIQIMAYDQAAEQANIDLASLMGDDDDDIDSMFDDIFAGPSHAKDDDAPIRNVLQPPRAAPSFISGTVAAVSRDPQPPPAVHTHAEAPSPELLGLLGSMGKSEPEVVSPSIDALDLHAASAARVEEAQLAEGSLESLLALARKDLATHQEKKPSRDILDDLLGDDLPPPPAPAAADDALSLPPAPGEIKEKKQGGFFSRLFGGDK